MKHIFKHPEPTEQELAGPQYWRSLDEVAETPDFQEFLEREFPDGASVLEGVDRRHFIKIMAASFALAGVGLAGCRRPEKHIIPYGQQPEQIVSGNALYYATSMPRRRHSLPLLAETHTGRPTKLEGNPSFDLTNGKTDLQGQAAILDLYDPDRAVWSKSGETVLMRDDVFALVEKIAAKFKDNGGAGLAFLADQSGSPTRHALVAEIQKLFPKAIWAEYEPLDDSGADRAASRLVGERVRPVYHLGSATRILTLDSDLVNPNASVYYGQSFARGRNVDGDPEKMNRLYTVESGLSTTGGMADHRLRVASSLIPALAAQLAVEILQATGNGGGVAQGLQTASSGLEEKQVAWIRECARDLVEHKGSSLIVAGPHQPEAVQALVFALNQALGNVGKTVEFLAVDEPEAASIQQLAEAIGKNSVQTLFILDGNPVYNAPGDLGWESLQQKVGEVVRYGYYVDETSQHADHHIAATHFLETWGDGRAIDGRITVVQPMIEPLFDGINLNEILATLAGLEERDGYALLQQTIAKVTGGGEKEFRKFLHDGFLEEGKLKTVSGSFDAGRVQEIAKDIQAGPTDFSEKNLEVLFVRDNRIDDGRFGNNGWLQECPDPITKITWDNYIQVSPRLGDELGIVPGEALVQVANRDHNKIDRGKEVGRHGKLTINGRTIEGAIHVQPGLANYTVILPLGYGRTHSGRIGNGHGFNPSSVRTSEGFFIATGATLEIIDETSKLANTQAHWSMEGRAIIREGNLETYKKEPAFAQKMGVESHAPANLGTSKDMPIRKEVKETPRGLSLYEHPDRNGVNQWGMVIDLNSCSGCSACVVACQAENNIPIVGKDQVLRGREMHWMRLDRYFATGKSGNSELADDPQVVYQPMLCQHCDNAPCEVVCPVNATVQDTEGLNVMVYNRCIGTRYCANNCPYKVRRFNFFDWNERPLDKLYLGPLAPKGMAETLKMQKNPDVTVRMRGVMEKCSFCIQRITEAKVAQKVKAGDSGDVMVRDGAVQTACQQACPSESITFGNMMDPESEVVKLKNNSRNYSVLGYLNTRPRLTYLAKVRNPNKRMPDYVDQPLTTMEYRAANYPAGHAHNGQAETSNGGHN